MLDTVKDLILAVMSFKRQFILTAYSKQQGSTKSFAIFLIAKYQTMQSFGQREVLDKVKNWEKWETGMENEHQLPNISVSKNSLFFFFFFFFFFVHVHRYGKE